MTDVSFLMEELLQDSPSPITPAQITKVAKATRNPDTMKVVGQSLAEALKTKTALNPVLKSLFVIDKLLLHKDTCPTFVASLAKWRPGFVKFRDTFSFDRNGLDVGCRVREMAAKVVEDLDCALEQDNCEEEVPPAYEEEEAPVNEPCEEGEGVEEEETKQVEEIVTKVRFAVLLLIVSL
eukprot:TRINITY_DN1278_c0_g2_i2.p1 TRINITY_DN1278_c0_g2~~TRINITY_DN1278_c0_g2_i2.p1  ORF type:complete len:194 (-),score=65.27 TRINITY_DN1278_c0_g2_i2:48-587(-)